MRGSSPVLKSREGFYDSLELCMKNVADVPRDSFFTLLNRYQKRLQMFIQLLKYDVALARSISMLCT